MDQAPDIIFVFGKICSGKDTFASDCTDREQIASSDIVKSIIKSKDRKSLQDTAHLDKKIAAGIFEKIEKNKLYCITGIRQLSILLKLKFLLQSNVITFHLIWLEASDEELKGRYESRGDARDKDLSFEEALKRDDNLGLGELEDWLTYQNEEELTVINNE